MSADEQLIERLLDQLVAAELESRPRDFWGLQFDLGLADVSFPVGRGGLGLSPDLQRIVGRRLRERRAPDARANNPIALGFAAATIAAHGTPEQQQRYLRPMFTGEEQWCQLFSEPGAGSDLAGLSTRAVRDGADWVVNGQKVWTSRAHLSQLGILLARTDPDAPKHRGLTYFIIDMSADGVDVRPLRQMTGEAEFNEVYLEDVRLSDDKRVGDLGSGWRVAITTLANERQGWARPGMPRGSGLIARALERWRESSPRDAVRRDQLVQLWVRAEAYRLNNLRGAQRDAEGNPGPEGSVAKIIAAELNKDISSFTVELLGPAGALYSGYDLVVEQEQGLDDHFSFSDSQRAFLRTRANSIEAGTTEINKNIVAQRVLGLPGDIKVDRDRPWRDLQRN